MNRLVALGVVCGVVLAGTVTAEAPKREDIPKFLMNLKSQDPKVRIAGCQGLASMGKVKAAYAKDGIAPMLELLKKDSDVKVRAAAASALGSCDPEDYTDVVAGLIEAFKDSEDKDVRAASATSLGQLGAKAKDALPALKEAAAKAKTDGDKKLSKSISGAVNAIQKAK